MQTFKLKMADYYISKNIFSKPQTPPRNVKSYEIELYTTNGNISLVNDARYTQKAGNILISKPGDIRRSIGHFECYYVHFLCNDSAICSALENLPTVFFSVDNESLKKIFKNLLDSPSYSGLSKTLFLSGNLAELIGVLLSENTKNYCGKFEQYIPDIISACKFMENNCEQHLTLSDISASVNLSAGFFHRVFKSVKNITPYEYLMSFRIEKAKSMLRKSNLSLAEIAILCGFGSQGYFNYVFKKQTNRTPKEYRDKKQIII